VDETEKVQRFSFCSLIRMGTGRFPGARVQISIALDVVTSVEMYCGSSKEGLRLGYGFMEGTESQECPFGVVRGSRGIPDIRYNFAILARAPDSSTRSPMPLHFLSASSYFWIAARRLSARLLRDQYFCFGG
jgi:hypothetical protein